MKGRKRKCCASQLDGGPSSAPRRPLHPPPAPPRAPLTSTTRPPSPPSRERETDSRVNMDGVPAIINISISLRIQPNEGPVFFKVDGTRFGQNRTIKLLTGSKYKIEVAMKPGTVEAT